MYFYVTDGTNAVSGSKQVIIDKAAQTAPDATKLFTRSETRRNSLDGVIAGLTARKMEYRNKANDGTYYERNSHDGSWGVLGEPGRSVFFFPEGAHLLTTGL